MIEKELLVKYFEGHCTPGELKTILAWLKDEKNDQTLLLELMTARWEMGKSTVGEEELNTGVADLKPRLLADLRQRLYPSVVTSPLVLVPDQAGEAIRDEYSVPAAGAGRRFLRYGMAASVAGILFLGGWIFHEYRLRSLAAQWRSLSNTSTRIKYCLLPDSTRVWLNPNSTLSWSMPVDAQRSVKIEGQAFFDVAKDENRPMIVHSGPLITKVLGTAFNIEAYPEEKEVRVALVNGKVAIQAAAENEPVAAENEPAHAQPLKQPGKHPAGHLAQILNGGEMLTYLKETNTIHKGPLKMTALPDWTSGYLTYSEVPVKVALERMERLYHFHLHYHNGIHLENYRFSTVFTKEETPEQMIKNILFITDCTYRITGNDVEIIKK